MSLATTDLSEEQDTNMLSHPYRWNYMCDIKAKHMVIGDYPFGMGEVEL
jgi:hypothetical protein